MVSYTDLEDYDESSGKDVRRPGCPGEDLGECLYFLSEFKLFKLLRREPPTLRTLRINLKADAIRNRRRFGNIDQTAELMYRLALKEYPRVQPIADKLFYFLDSQPTDEEPHDDELRRKIVRGLADHVRLCAPCDKKYYEELWERAKERIGPKKYSSNEEELLAITAAVIIMDRNLLGLLAEED